MTPPGAALWRTLHASGHDAALLSGMPGGWLLTGVAAWEADGEPAALSYRVELDADWSARSGWFGGSVGSRRIEHRIARAGDAWTLDGVRQPGLEAAVDLDFGFTPATNAPQLKRMALAVGEARRVTVAWIDADGEALAPLPQDYRRTAPNGYAYASPDHGYRAELTVADDGFVVDYPGLWTRVGG